MKYRWSQEGTVLTLSLPLWERGLKFFEVFALNILSASLPLWERGLKLRKRTGFAACPSVAPLVGAWIEISYLDPGSAVLTSLPLWERGLKSMLYAGPGEPVASLPLWERGLKFIATMFSICNHCRSPCGSVD